MKQTIADIVKATGGKLLSGEADTPVKDIITDSRKLSEGMFFVPLVGENFDGHDFIDEAFRLGAVGVVTQKEIPLPKEGAVILVKDTKKALWDIAHAHRMKFDIPVVAVTGSVGKTTTKELIHAVMSEKYKTLKTKGNFNNEIGLPLTLLKLREKHQAAVVEMGMSALGEISNLTRIAHPSVGVITNVGTSHIEKLGSVQGILRAKLEIFEGFTDEDQAVLNADDLLLFGAKHQIACPILYYGIYNHAAQVRGENIVYEGEEGTDFDITYEGHTVHVRLDQPGEYMVYNALAAVAVGLTLGISMEEAVAGLKHYVPEKMRMNIKRKNGLTVLDDCYNASVMSMNAALGILVNMKNPRKVAVLGDMFEMGSYAKEGHLTVGREVAKCAVDLLVAIGDNAKYYAEGARAEGMKEENIHYFETKPQALEFLKEALMPKDAVLIKASRGMQMEAITNVLCGE